MMILPFFIKRRIGENEVCQGTRFIHKWREADDEWNASQNLVLLFLGERKELMSRGGQEQAVDSVGGFIQNGVDHTFSVL
jgi:hypothetical protein